MYRHSRKTNHEKNHERINKTAQAANDEANRNRSHAKRNGDKQK